jgi:GT2 family glycosyltransferase
MRRSLPLLGFAVGLDLAGMGGAALLAAAWSDRNPALALQADGLLFGLGFLLLAWFLGGYSYLDWPWQTFRKLAQRWLLVLCSTLALALLTGGLLNLPPTAVWWQPSTMLILGMVWALWGLWHRSWLQPLVRAQARQCHAATPLAVVQPHQQRQLLLLFVAFHPSLREVELLQSCLAALPSEVGYAVVVNDHRPGEPVEQLATGADGFLFNRDNPGYGRAVNRLVAHLGQLPPYIGVLNTDLSWAPGTFEQLLGWLQEHSEVSLAVPQILDEAGSSQSLCKQNPTVLGLFSRRFLPNWLKPSWLKRYDGWYVMADQNYQATFDAPYLSGCCMLIRSQAFVSIDGFDERYFLYLEDADLTRCLARQGRCLHLPMGAVTHGWGRGNYLNIGLAFVNIISAWQYFRKWGWAIW